MKPVARLRAALLLAIALAACAPRHALPPAETGARPAIGPFPAFDGRLIVIEPGRRWQALVRWRAATPELGEARLTHPASGLIVEIRWRGESIRIRDSRHRRWREMPRQELARMGIMLPPKELAALLLGRLPADFRPAAQTGRWQARRDGRLLRIEWHAERRQLRLTDITRGASATLLIQWVQP